MTDLRKAAEMALEALEQGYSSRLWPIQSINAIQALREALAQPEREWVNLTEKEIVEATHFVSGVYDRARAIEAKLKEKNHE